MKITIESVGMALTAALRDYIEKKFSMLQKLVTRFEDEGDLMLRVEVSRVTRHHRKGEIYRVLADIRLPKKILRVDESAEDMRAAVDFAKDVLKAEIEKYKKRLVTSVKVREGK